MAFLLMTEVFLLTFWCSQEKEGPQPSPLPHAPPANRFLTIADWPRQQKQRVHRGLGRSEELTDPIEEGKDALGLGPKSMGHIHFRGTAYGTEIKCF